MALTRKDKEQLLEAYKKDLQWAKNVVALKQYSIPVNEINSLRMDMFDAWWKFSTIKKRVFIKFASENWLEWWALEDMDWSVSLVYSYEDEFAPLKVISKYKKKWSKEKKNYWFEYLWWWFDNSWKDKDYVAELSSIPSKEELIWKLAYLLNYPLQSFAMAIDQITKKQD